MRVNLMTSYCYVYAIYKKNRMLTRCSRSFLVTAEEEEAKRGEGKKLRGADPILSAGGGLALWSRACKRKKLDALACKLASYPFLPT